MPTGSGGTGPAAADRVTASCSSGDAGLQRCPQAAAVSAADPDRPDTSQPSGHRPRFRKQQRTAVASAVSGSAATRTPAAVFGCIAGCGPAGAVPVLRQCRAGCACLVCAGRVCQVDAAGGSRLSGGADTGGGLPDTGSQDAPGTADTQRPPQGQVDTAAAVTLDGRQQHRPPPHPCPTGTGPQCAASASTPGRPPGPQAGAQRPRKQPE